MRGYIRILFLLCAIFLTCSCASRSDLSPSEWVYEKNRIRLELKADHQLNMYEGSPHTLYLCVYQLKDPNAFNGRF